MRMVVLAHNLRVAGGLSVGRNVIAALRRVADEHEYLIFMPHGCGYEEIEKPSRATCHFYRRRGGWDQWRYESRDVRKAALAFKADVVWGLGNFGLVDPGAAQAFLFHKPHFIYGPRHNRAETLGNKVRNAVARRRLLRSLKDTQLVFCQTNTAATRFRRFLGYDGAIAIMPNAVSRFTAAAENCEAPPVFARLGGKKVLFCLTKYYAHKNLEYLVRLFEKHGEELGDVVVVLTVAADQHRLAPAFLKSIQVPSVQGHFVNVGPVRQDELAAYYTHSDALILPTVLESFTGTYLEAMQFKRPILTSDLDFAHDVCGDAALYFDPWDVDAGRDAIRRLLDEPGLADTLIAAGTKRLETMFRSWDDIVAEAVHKLEDLARGVVDPADVARGR